jgi:hypothetical protein
MRTPIVVLLIGIAILAIGGAWYGFEIWPQQQFRAGLDRTLATLPPGITATYRNATYSVPTRHAVVTGFAIKGTIGGASPEPFELTIASIETDNADLAFAAAWSDAVAHPEARRPDAAIPVADAIVLKDVAFHANTVNATAETLRLAKPRLYPWALLHDGMPSWSAIEAAARPGSAPKPPNDFKVILRVEAAAMLGAAYDAYEAGPVRFNATTPDGTISYMVRHMTADGFDRGDMRNAVAEVVTGETGLADFSVDRMTMDALDLRQPLMRLMDDEPLAMSLLDGIRLGHVSYSGFSVHQAGQPNIRIGELSIGPVEFTGGLPVKGAFGWTDVAIARDQLPEAKGREAFDQLGLATMTVSFATEYDWDVGRRHLTLRDTTLKIDELGTLGVSAEAEGIVPTMAGLAGAKLTHARLRFEDASLVNRALRAAAAQTGADPAAFRQQIIDTLRQQGTGGSAVSPRLSAAGRTVSDFIASPGVLTVELSPRAPVPFLTLAGVGADPARAAELLNLVVSLQR